MRHLLIIILSSLLGGTAWALDPPSGWTSTGEHTAIQTPGHPELGEIHEFLAAGGSGAPVELEFILIGAGMEPSSVRQLSGGSVELIYEDRQGRARFRADSDPPAWLVVLTDIEADTNVDADAVLLSMLPLPRGLGAGTETPTPLDAGFDGNPWASNAEDGSDEASNVQGWWAPQDNASVWSQDRALVGLWEGTAFVRGQPSQLKIRMEADGVLVLEMRRGAQLEAFEGNWASMDGAIRLALDEGGTETSNYELIGTTLNLRYGGISYDLVLRR